MSVVGKGEREGVLVWFFECRLPRCYQVAGRRGGLADKIGNGENFRGVAHFYSGDSAAAQSLALPSIAISPLIQHSAGP